MQHQHVTSAADTTKYTAAARSRGVWRYLPRCACDPHRYVQTLGPGLALHAPRVSPGLGAAAGRRRGERREERKKEDSAQPAGAGHGQPPLEFTVSVCRESPLAKSSDMGVAPCCYYSPLPHLTQCVCKCVFVCVWPDTIHL